ncbi:MAG: glycosyltransferase [Isosphaeraceae bacterium]
MADPRRVGYLVADLFSNATVCIELTGLIRAGVPLEVVSLHPSTLAADQGVTSADAIQAAATTLEPSTLSESVRALVLGPCVFGRRFALVLARALFGRAESLGQRRTMVSSLLPALVLALRWRKRNVGQVHAQQAQAATTLAMHVSELLGVGFSFTGHADDLFVHREGLKAKVHRARFVVCISEFHRRFFQSLGADPARLKVVYCGVDVDRFLFPNTGASATGKGMNPPRILAIGKLHERKGFHDLVQACSHLRDQGIPFQCTIAGAGPELRRLEAMVKRNGLTDCVTLTGEPVRPDALPGLLSTARVFALPCTRDAQGGMDGLPQILIEALLCGVPVVSTRLVGIPDLVRHAETGLLVDPGDTQAADSLHVTLGSSVAAARLGSKGREDGRTSVETSPFDASRPF